MRVGQVDGHLRSTRLTIERGKEIVSFLNHVKIAPVVDLGIIDMAGVCDEVGLFKDVCTPNLINIRPIVSLAIERNHHFQSKPGILLF